MSLVRRRAYTPSRGAGALLGSGARALYKVLQSSRRARSNTIKREPASISSAPLTGQYDYKTDYTKRRMTRRKYRKMKVKRRWRRKVVNTVRNANVGSTHIVRRSLANITSGPNASDAVTYGIYGQNGDSNDTFNSCADIREMFREISESDWVAALSGGSSRLHKIYSMHATMEMTVRNQGETDALIEAYYIRGTKATPGGVNPTTYYARGFDKSQLAQDPNTGNLFDTKLTFQTIGTTPFQSTLFCQNFKIYKRTKFRIAPGQEINFVIHDRKARTFSMDYARTRSTDRSYHGVLFQQQGSPNTVGGDQIAQSTNVVYLSIRRYRIKMFADNLPQNALDSSGS